MTSAGCIRARGMESMEEGSSALDQLRMDLERFYRVDQRRQRCRSSSVDIGQDFQNVTAMDRPRVRRWPWLAGCFFLSHREDAASYLAVSRRRTIRSLMRLIPWAYSPDIRSIFPRFIACSKTGVACEWAQSIGRRISESASHRLRSVRIFYSSRVSDRERLT